MQSLYSLPVLEDLFSQSRFHEALAIADEAPEALAPYIHGRFPQQISLSPEDSLILAKILLLQKEYEGCVFHALASSDLLHTLEPFYHDSILFHMMRFLCAHPSHSFVDVPALKHFILQKIQSEKPGPEDPVAVDESLLGFLAEISEWSILKQHIVALSGTDIDCHFVVDSLLEFYYDDIHKMFLETSLTNQYLIKYKIDALISGENIDDLRDLLLQLPWQQMYSACFYVEDTHHVKLETGNENANLILSGEWKQEIMSNFMFKNSKTSFKFLESMSKARAPYVSLCNCIMNAGTTNDTLYRNNKGVMNGREWIRFLEFSAVGMIHQGNINAFEILKEMLPSLETNNGEPAALMALGLMKARTSDSEVVDFLLNWLDSTSEEILFGACMGLGLCLLESCDGAVFHRLQSLLSMDNTIAQESALYAIGLIYAGSGDESIAEYLLSLLVKTDFPRVKRVCGIALALVSIYTCKNFEYRNGASMLGSFDPIEREAILLSLGTAYVASSDMGMIKKILPFINDGDDDVKRAAVVAIAFIGCEDPLIMSSCLVPLAQNHNFFVRSAVALLLGFFNSGSGDESIANLLEALLYDSNDLVRQGACLGTGFILSQMNPTLIPNYKRILDRINQVIVSKGEPNCVKIGASIGRAVAEAGGRSAVFSLGNFSKIIEVKRVAAALLFIESWYWYPLMSTLSLCLLPTPIFFFDQNLDETDDKLNNDSKFYDYLVKLPEVRRSRKFKASKEDAKDTLIEAPKGLKSGMRLTELERNLYGLDCGVIFRDRQ